MSIEKSDSGSDHSACKIISKYFTSKPGMDESLSDFQEKKVTYTRPKNKKPLKCNTTKKDKKLKGQRDIRTLVKSKKNELVTYTKDFDEACKSSGLDVDSEQLQIAIALSKSLQESQPQHNEASDNVKPLTAKERSRKIKSTLQEYGFKVPNSIVQKSKRRGTNKNSKLLNTSESEKRELIRRKYLEIFQKNHTSTTCGLVEFDHSDKEVYYKTTNIPYSKIRTIDEFYVPNLLEKTSHRTCLLRDWSEIPGRPLSPVVETNQFKFDEFLFSQQELDCLLSHPLHEVQVIIKNKSMEICEEIVANIEKTKKLKSEIEVNNREIFDIDDAECNVKFISISQGDRSESPDLFDEDDYPKTVNRKDQTQCSEIKCGAGSDKTSFMDLTECIGDNIQKTIIMHSNEILSISSSKISQDPVNIETEPVDTSNSFRAISIFQNLTKSETVSQNKTFQIGSQSTLCSGTVPEVNDFMEVTDCVVSEFNYNDNNSKKNEIVSKSTSMEETVDVDIYSQKIKSADVNKSVPIDFTKSNSTYSNTKNIENIDLTQVSNKTNDDLLTCEVENNQIKASISMDLTQSSNSDEEFPIVQLSTNKDESSDATIILYDHNMSNNVLKENILTPKNVMSPNDEKHCNNKKENKITTIAKNDYYNAVNEENNKVFRGSNIVELNEDLPVINRSEVKNCNLSSISHDSKVISEDNIDLTESPELETSGEGTIDITQSPLSPSKTHSIESLGKQNNVSIDYDELYDNMMTDSTDIIQDQEDLKKCNRDSIIELIDHDNEHSNTLNIDKMLNSTDEYHILKDYSFRKSTEIIKENPDLQASANSSLHEEHISIYSTNRSCSYLPNVEIKKSKKIKDMITETNHNEHSPIRISNTNNKSFGTPTNDQYIIKTVNVTPMLDYESMSTPARIKELEKYGIKPFKRKRAIQLLTYIYNQTHPVVEDCETDGIPSTSKKFKPDTREKSDNKEHLSSRALKERDADKENSLYSETKVNPDIKEIECCSDDWVFQTREKAKVHSCRVPLHVAFHNYVSCRHMLRTAILRYEPVNIDIIHKDLIESGYRYNPKELLKFLDKKCITVKTTENNCRNRKLNKS